LQTASASVLYVVAQQYSSSRAAIPPSLFDPIFTQLSCFSKGEVVK